MKLPKSSCPWIKNVSGFRNTTSIYNAKLNPDLTTALHRAAFKSLYLLLGTGLKFLSTLLPGVDKDIPNTIAQNIQTFCTKYNNDIQHDISVKLLRENNTILMPKFTNANFTNKERQIINQCRVYLRIMTMADMTTGDRTMILSNIWEGKWI